MTIIRLRYWILILVVFTSGCATEPSKYTTRQCLIQLIGQTAPGQVAAQLLCEKEEPFTPEKPE